MQKEKSIGRNILIVVLILVTIASVCAGLFAWAKYQTTINGTATGETAKWSFKADGNTTTDEIDFAITRTDNNTSVVEGKLAPGTYGEIPVEIDATGTETMVEYSIVVALTNMPTNMKFYSNPERTNPISINKDDKVCVRGFIGLNAESKVVPKTIYWEWPFETGLTAAGIANHDKVDMEDASKEVTMNIVVTGTQAKEERRYLSNEVQVGDYVNYDANSNGEYKFTSAEQLAGTTISADFSSTDKFNGAAKSQWRVLSVDNVAGTVELISADPTAKTVTLSAGDGFANAETVLNNIGAIYGHGDGAIGGRSINVDDIDQYSIFDKTTYISNQVYYYGKTVSYESGNFYKEMKDNNGNIIGYETTITAASDINPITMTHLMYLYTALDYFTNQMAYNVLFKNSTSTGNSKSTYWLASRSLHLSDSDCSYGVRRIYDGTVNNYSLYRSNGITNSPAYKVCPVVSLESNIQTTGQNSNGVWQLKVN
ncbi:MAG: hypothetical protein E7313_01175 [Clostridiales bacterium]|nr:hypothetical protein [Clostridiales bacterium]